VIVQAHLALHNYTVRAEMFQLQNNAWRIAEELLEMYRQRSALGSLSDTVLTKQMLENLVSKISRDRSLIDLLDSYNTLLVTLGFGFDNWGQDLRELTPEIPEDMETIDIENTEERRISTLPNSVSPGFRVADSKRNTGTDIQDLHFININPYGGGGYV